jgi:hypothetical protein
LPQLGGALGPTPGGEVVLGGARAGVRRVRQRSDLDVSMSAAASSLPAAMAVAAASQGVGIGAVLASRGNAKEQVIDEARDLAVEPGIRDGRDALVRWAVLLEDVIP